jgi:hypothetical protein
MPRPVGGEYRIERFREWVTVHVKKMSKQDSKASVLIQFQSEPIKLQA